MQDPQSTSAGLDQGGTERTRPEDAPVRGMTKVEEWKQLSAGRKTDLRTPDWLG